MKLRYIRFCFENCDFLEIDGKYIGDIFVEQIQTSIRRLACNSIDEILMANAIAVEIHKNANKERFQFEYQFETSSIIGSSQKTFDRIKYGDVTYIDLLLESSDIDREPTTKQYFYSVNWSDENEEVNASQKNYISRDGHLYIVIATDKGIDDYFDMKKINDNKWVDYHFKMYDVGE